MRVPWAREVLITSSKKKIIKILSDGKFHSGATLARELAVSRSAICKQIKSFNELGLEINSITGKGYRLVQPLQLLSETEIRKKLTILAGSFIAKLEIHDCINSTNSYLNEKSQTDQSYQENSLAHICFAEFQTAGKGRRGRDWVSPFGSNIYLSILWTFQKGPASIAGLSLAVGVAVIRALNDLGIDDVGLKWPNDILWKKKKLAGILIEVSGEVSGPCQAVIGLGLNFYLPKDQAKSITQEWVDLKQLLVDNPEKIRNQLAATLLNHLLPTIASFKENALTNYLEEWRQFDCMNGQEATLYMGEHAFSGVVKGIDDKGMLLLSNNKGEIKAFGSGEVSFRQS